MGCDRWGIRYVYAQSSADTSTQSTIQSTFHGDHHETIQYGTTTGQPGSMTLSNGQTMTYGRNLTTFKLTSQTIPCYYCGGLQEKSVSYDPSGNPTSLTDFNNNTQTRIYDQLRGVPTSITEASGTSLAQTTTYQWDSRFLKPTLITQSVALGTGLGMKTTENDCEDVRAIDGVTGSHFEAFK